jgi:tetratricopeptide (TPR) repeat protein
VALSDRAGAEEAFGKALALDPADGISALNLGNLRALAGDAAGAERFYLRCLAADEARAEAHLNLGLVYTRFLNRAADAAPHLRRFLELAPNDPEAPAIRALLAKPVQ